MLGELTAKRELVVRDSALGGAPVAMPMEVLFGKPPKMTRRAARTPFEAPEWRREQLSFTAAVDRVLAFPAVADKSFLIHIGDRTVGGLVARDQLVGPWQVPVSDVAVTAAGYEGYTGEAFAMGERTPVAIHDGPASARLAVAEAVLNIAAADVAALARHSLVRELDGGRRPRRRRLRALRDGARRRRGALPGARHRRARRQGLLIYAHGVAATAAASAPSRRPCR